MADTELFDDTISSEEILDVRRSLQEIIKFYQQKTLQVATRDESAALVGVRNELACMRSCNTALGDTLTSYNNFNLDDAERGPDVNNIRTFAEIDETSGAMPMTPQILDEAKKELDEFVTGIPDGNDNQDRALENLNVGSQEQQISTTQNNVSAVRDSATAITPVLTGERLVPSEYKDRFKNHIVTECIPCLGRVTNVANIRPIADLANLVRVNIENTEVIFNRLEKLLWNDEVLNDLCNLLGFLKFMCVPDLMALSSFLGLLFAKYSDLANLSFSGVSLSGLITPIFSPIVASIVALLDRVLSLIGAPIECMVESLDDIIARIDIEAGARQFRTTAINERNRLETGVTASQQVANRIAQQRLLLEEKRDLDRQSSSIRRVIARLNSENPETNAARIADLRRDLVALGYDENGGIVRGGLADKNRIKYDTLRQEIRQLRGNVPKTKTTLREARDEIRNAQAAFGKGLKDLRTLMFQGQNLLMDSLRSNLDELQKILGLNGQNALTSIETAQNLQRITRMLSLVKFLIKNVGASGDPCDPETNTSQIVGSFLRSVNSANPLTQSATNDFDTSPVPQVAKGRFGEDTHLIVFPAGATLQVTGEDQTPRDIEEVKRFNASGDLPDVNNLLPNVGDLAQANLTAIIPETQTAVQPTVIPLDLCVKSGDANAAANIRDWVSTIQR